jgi:cbb3-type cytochrome oxidase subunit 3
MDAKKMSMIPPLILVSLCLFILIVYFALSKQSSLFIRRTAVIALILIGIAVAVSLYLIFSEPTVTLTPLPSAEIPPEKPVPIKVVKSTPIVVIAILFLLFIALIVYISFRDQRRDQHKKREQGHSPKAKENLRISP